MNEASELPVEVTILAVLFCCYYKSVTSGFLNTWVGLLSNRVGLLSNGVDLFSGERVRPWAYFQEATIACYKFH